MGIFLPRLLVTHSGKLKGSADPPGAAGVVSPPEGSLEGAPRDPQTSLLLPKASDSCSPHASGTWWVQPPVTRKSTSPHFLQINKHAVFAPHLPHTAGMSGMEADPGLLEQPGRTSPDLISISLRTPFPEPQSNITANWALWPLRATLHCRSSPPRHKLQSTKLLLWSPYILHHQC